MSQTKDAILLAALRLFARDGYEAVSVSAIAAQIGITKGALYRHYASKRDIFDQILARMEQGDSEQAAACHVPVGAFDTMPEVYRRTGLADLLRFTEEQFVYWTQNEFAACFRRMLTLEQYRSPEMASLYRNYLSGGPLGYVEDLLRTMVERGILCGEPQQLALAFYGPMHLLMSLADTGDLDDARARLHEHLMDFMRVYVKSQTD